jgi:hypothetical protein
MEIYLTLQLTQAHQEAALKYLYDLHGLSAADWKMALTAFDLLRECRVAQQQRERTFAEFYEEMFDRPAAQPFLSELLQMDELQNAGRRRARELGRQLWAQATATLPSTLTRGQRLLAAYCIYWWNSFCKGYLNEILIFRDLTQAGIAFEAHDLTQPGARFSHEDLVVSGWRGDIKSSSYFLFTARHFPLQHDFYIASLFDPSTRQLRQVVMLQPAAWAKIDGETKPAPLEQALNFFSQPVSATVRGQELIIVAYELWKEKILVWQQRGTHYE